MKVNQDVFEIRLDGGELSLDFANTVDDRYEEPQDDHRCYHHFPKSGRDHPKNEERS